MDAWERNDAIRGLFEQEIQSLASGEFDVHFPAEKQVVSDWTLAGINAALDRAGKAVSGAPQDLSQALRALLQVASETLEVERVGEGIQVTFDSGILFDFDSYALRPEAREHLTELFRPDGEYLEVVITRG